MGIENNRDTEPDGEIPPIVLNVDAKGMPELINPVEALITGIKIDLEILGVTKESLLSFLSFAPTYATVKQISSKPNFKPIYVTIAKTVIKICEKSPKCAEEAYLEFRLRFLTRLGNRTGFEHLTRK